MPRSHLHVGHQCKEKWSAESNEPATSVCWKTTWARRGVPSRLLMCTPTSPFRKGERRVATWGGAARGWVDVTGSWLSPPGSRELGMRMAPSTGRPCRKPRRLCAAQRWAWAGGEADQIHTHFSENGAPRVARCGGTPPSPKRAPRRQSSVHALSGWPLVPGLWTQLLSPVTSCVLRVFHRIRP